MSMGVRLSQIENECYVCDSGEKKSSSERSEKMLNSCLAMNVLKIIV